MVDWNECLKFDGDEKSLPVGIKTKIPGFRAIDLVKRWEVNDPEEDEGYRVVKRSEIGPNDIVIGAQINENSVNRIKAPNRYGDRYATFKNLEYNEYLTREEWEIATRPSPEVSGSDVLVLEALRELRQGNVPYVIKSK